jgi:histidinol dehydrogenase
MNNSITTKVQKIIEDVKKFGDKAVLKYTRMFDNIPDFSSKDIKIEIKNSPKINDNLFKNSVKLAIENVRKFHIAEFESIKKYWIKKYNNIEAGMKFIPVDSVGVYIPGGRFGYNYISTLIMTVIPAQIAKVKKIVVVTPPRNVSEYFLYTAYVLNIREIYRVGGAQAIAALAFGTETIPKVDLIVGPGNIWVSEAKRQLIGTVGIDLIAGPSEVVVVTDGTYPIEVIISELLAQAEHDKDAKSWLISLDKHIIEKVKNLILTNAKERFSQIQFKYVKDIDTAINIINTIAPEHLTLFTKKQNVFIKKIKNAGAVFYGENPSAVFGDYIAGPSHVLPTNTTARFSSGLSILTFLKKISLIKFSKKSTKILAKYTAKLAEIEGMEWHKKRVEIYETKS